MVPRVSTLLKKFAVHPPPPFDFTHRQPGQSWRNWKQRLQIYLDASGYDSASDRKNTSLFLNAIGPNCIEFYHIFKFTEEEEIQHDDTPTFTVVVTTFDDHFRSSVNVTFERHRFFVRDQARVRQSTVTLLRYVIWLLHVNSGS